MDENENHDCVHQEDFKRLIGEIERVKSEGSTPVLGLKGDLYHLREKMDDVGRLVQEIARCTQQLTTSQKVMEATFVTSSKLSEELLDFMKKIDGAEREAKALTEERAKTLKTEFDEEHKKVVKMIADLQTIITAQQDSLTTHKTYFKLLGTAVGFAWGIIGALVIFVITHAWG